MKILLIDHAFHQKTISSNFFVNLVEKKYQVEKVFFDPLDPSSRAISEFDQSINWESFDLVIVWQLEVLGILANARGIPTMLVPMYDGSSGLSPDLWFIHNESSILHFSYNLSLRTENMVARQTWVQYFPDPNDYKVVQHSTPPRIFFWMRRPEEFGIGSAFRLSRHGFQRFHVHIATDDPNAEIDAKQWEKLYGITTSKWFESKSEFSTFLDDFNVFICPRLSEGIGMAMLDGLARGMCVLANRQPTHTEYIANGLNGYLFDEGSYSPIDLINAPALGAMARKGVEKGWRRWQQQIPEIYELIEETASFEIKNAVTVIVARELVHQYFVEPERYANSVRSICTSREMTGASANQKNYRREVFTASKEGADDADPGLERVRLFFQRLPGWNYIKKIIPLKLRRRMGHAVSAFLQADS